VHRVANAGNASPGHFLFNHHLMTKIATTTAVFNRNRGTQNAGLPCLQPGIAINDTLLVPALDMWHKFTLEKPRNMRLHNTQFFVHPRCFITADMRERG
jgi:hypothetical protein